MGKVPGQGSMYALTAVGQNEDTIMGAAKNPIEYNGRQKLAYCPTHGYRRVGGGTEILVDFEI